MPAYILYPLVPYHESYSIDVSNFSVLAHGWQHGQCTVWLYRFIQFTHFPFYGILGPFFAMLEVHNDVTQRFYCSPDPRRRLGVAKRTSLPKLVPPRGHKADVTYILRGTIMPYLNADGVLPPELLSEIQKYVQGALVYVPRQGTERLGWGHKNGTRDELDRRNAAIREAKACGHTIDQLADQYCLSTDGIRKILYCAQRGTRKAS